MRVQFNDTTLSQTMALKRAVAGGDMGAAQRILRLWLGRTPDIRATVRQVLNIARVPRSFRPLIEAAATLAAEQNTNHFHNNRHFLEVFFLAAVLGAHARREWRLSARNYTNLLVAALIHDYKHDGTGNQGVQYRLEEQSFQSAKPALAAAGAHSDDLELIHACVLATDVSVAKNAARAVSPADMLKHWQTSRNPQDVAPELRILVSRHAVDMALMLHDADVGTSVLAPDISVNRSRALAREMGVPYQSGISRYFFEKICAEQMFSRSGFKLMQPYLNRTMRNMGLAGRIKHYLPAQRACG